MKSRKVRLRASRDIVPARHACREMAQELGFGSADQTRLATAVSEIARNAIQYGGGGVCTIRDESDGEESRIRVVIEDNGPGIPDIEQAMEHGFTTGGGLGAGLSSAKRLVQSFDIESEPGHTVVTIVMKRKRTGA